MHPYHLGCRVLDRDHEIMLNLVEQLRAAIAGRRARQTLDRIFMELKAYFDAHFENEDELMEVSRFSERRPHQEEHERIRREIHAVAAALDDGERAAARLALLTLHDWMDSHIGGTDRVLAEHLNRLRGDQPAPGEPTGD